MVGGAETVLSEKKRVGASCHKFVGFFSANIGKIKMTIYKFFGANIDRRLSVYLRVYLTVD